MICPEQSLERQQDRTDPLRRNITIAFVQYLNDIVCPAVDADGLAVAFEQLGLI